MSSLYMANNYTYLENLSVIYLSTARLTSRPGGRSRVCLDRPRSPGCVASRRSVNGTEPSAQVRLHSVGPSGTPLMGLTACSSLLRQSRALVLLSILPGVYPHMSTINNCLKMSQVGW